MAGIIVVGSQWGDEGKGKVVDVFSAEADLVVRYQGGANAGHTLIVNGKKTVLHLVPSGILHPKATCVIAAGVVLDVETLWDEICALRATGLLSDPSQLLISDSATIIGAAHKALDLARETAAGNEKIGTTGRGIGPAYEERAGRKALLFGDLFQPETLKHKLKSALNEKNFLLKEFYHTEPIDLDEQLHKLTKLAKDLAPFRCRDTSLIIHKALVENKKVLFEGAQGTLLDLNHGTYPYVTSSSTLAGSACVGSGIGPGAINKVIGITKAYTTRVGSGPFPTECDNHIGEEMREKGREFGATTGRRRRCGWLDLLALKYAIRINGITNIALMKIDVLSGFEQIKVCTSYELDGKVIDEFPVTPGDLARCQPRYHDLPGWSENLDHIRHFEDLPQQVRSYIQFIGDSLQTPIDVISVGPERDETIWIRSLF